MKVELIGHDEKYALEQSLLTLFPGEKPVYGTVDETADAHWVRVTLTEEDERVQVTTELGIDGRSAFAFPPSRISESATFAGRTPVRLPHAGEMPSRSFAAPKKLMPTAWRRCPSFS